jgi:hypothetical protein
MAWALDAGWVSAMTPGMTFEGDGTGFLGRFSSPIFSRFQVSVSLSAKDDHTEAVFFAEVGGPFPGAKPELTRAASTFAGGVSSYLEQLAPGHLDGPGEPVLLRRSRRGAMTKWLKAAHGILVIGLAPAIAVVYVITRTDIFAVLAALWIGTFMMGGIYLRYRIYGMRAWQVALGAYVMLAGSLLLSVVLATT